MISLGSVEGWKEKSVSSEVTGGGHQGNDHWAREERWIGWRDRRWNQDDLVTDGLLRKEGKGKSSVTLRFLAGMPRGCCYH